MFRSLLDSPIKSVILISIEIPYYLTFAKCQAKRQRYERKSIDLPQNVVYKITLPCNCQWEKVYAILILEFLLLMQYASNLWRTRPPLSNLFETGQDSVQCIQETFAAIMAYMFVLRSHISTAPSLTHPNTVAAVGDQQRSITAFCRSYKKEHTIIYYTTPKIGNIPNDKHAHNIVERSSNFKY